MIFARTETAMFFEHVSAKADGVLFLEGRLHFYQVDGTRAKGNAAAHRCHGLRQGECPSVTALLAEGGVLYDSHEAVTIRKPLKTS